MFGLEKIADAFDRIHADVQRDFDNLMLERGGRWAGDNLGPDNGWTYALAVPVGIGWSLGTFTLASGKALVDVLRLGDGVKSGTLSGAGQDALRVLNLIPVVSAGGKALGMAGTAGRTASVARAMGVVGQQGARSCGPTAIGAAARLSGRNVTLTLNEVGIATGKGIHPNAPNFPGMYLSEVRDVAQRVTGATRQFNVEGSGIQAIEQTAAQGNGPVIFGAHWWSKANGLTQVPHNVRLGHAQEAAHWLVAFRDASGKVLVADQFGVRPIADVGKIAGTVTEYSLAAEALLVSDGVLMRGVGVAEALGSASEPFRHARNAQWFAASFGINMVAVNAPTTWALDARIRERLGRQPRTWAGMPAAAPANGSAGGAAPDGKEANAPSTAAPATIPLPNVLSLTLQQDSMMVLGKIPPNGDSREFTQLQEETGLSGTRVRDALLQLARSGLISPLGWFMHDGKTTPSHVCRAMRR